MTPYYTYMKGKSKQHWEKWALIRRGGPTWKERHLTFAKNAFDSQILDLDLTAQQQDTY